MTYLRLAYSYKPLKFTPCHTLFLPYTNQAWNSHAKPKALWIKNYSQLHYSLWIIDDDGKHCWAFLTCIKCKRGTVGKQSSQKNSNTCFRYRVCYTSISHKKQNKTTKPPTKQPPNKTFFFFFPLEGLHCSKICITKRHYWVFSFSVAKVLAGLMDR